SASTRRFGISPGSWAWRTIALPPKEGSPMICSDVRKLLPDLALGDLDAEPAAQLSAHVKGCDACRAESEALGRTVGALRAPKPVAPSTERRAAAVAAMARAHADLSERILTRRSMRWVPLAAAAAFLLAVVGALT